MNISELGFAWFKFGGENASIWGGKWPGAEMEQRGEWIWSVLTRVSQLLLFQAG